MKKEKFWIRFLVFILIGVFLIYSGYFGFFKNLDLKEKFTFIFNFILLGIFTSALVLASKQDMRNWNNREFLLWGFICFVGSMILLFSLGLQGLSFLDEKTSFTNFMISVGNWGATFGVVLLFASLIGLTIITLSKMRVIYKCRTKPKSKKLQKKSKTSAPI